MQYGSNPITRGLHKPCRQAWLATGLLCVAGAWTTLAHAEESLDDDEPAPTQSEPKSSPSSLGSMKLKAEPAAPKEAPPPPEPSADEQYPRPYVAPPAPPGKERHVALMGVVGLWRHGFDSDSMSSKVGPVWGFAGRVEPYSWLGLRLHILRGNQPATPDAAALGVPQVTLTQSHYEITYWSFRMEPTWRVTSALALWAGVGFGWGRAIVPEVGTGAAAWRSADRACVFLEGQWATGAILEVIPNWLVLDLDLSTGALGYQDGSAHESIQAFTPEGHRTHLPGYPNFSRKVQALFGIGVIL